MKFNISKEQYIELWNLGAKEVCRSLETCEIAKRLNRDKNGNFIYYDKSLFDVIFKDISIMYRRIVISRILGFPVPEFSDYEVNEKELTIEFNCILESI